MTGHTREARDGVAVALALTTGEDQAEVDISEGVLHLPGLCRHCRHILLWGVINVPRWHSAVSLRGQPWEMG